MQTTIKVDGHFIRFENTVLSRAQVAEANIETGEVLMASGHAYRLTRGALESWFSDCMDSNKIENKEDVK